jgi:competence protein ComEC
MTLFVLFEKIYYDLKYKENFMKQQPLLLYPCISLILGIICANYSISLLIATMTLLAYLLTIITKDILAYKSKHVLFIFLFFFIGYFSFIQQQLQFSNFDKLTLEKSIDIIGIVNIISETDNQRFKYCTTLDIEKIKTENNWIKLNNKIQIYSLFKPFCNINDRILLKNIKLKLIKNLDFKKFLTRLNIANTLFTQKLHFKKINSLKFRPNIVIENIKSKLTHSLKLKMNPDCYSLFSSTFLGNKKINREKMEEINQKFVFWGMPHLIARSGLHLLILVFIFQFLLSFINHFIIKKILIILLVLFFHFTSWTAIPFTRSLFTYLIFEACNIFGIEYDTLHIFLLVCIIILITNPIEIFFLDFQLSFLITYILLWYSRHSFRNKKVLKKETKIA